MEEQQKHWYVIHTYSGYENKVKASLERKVKSLDMEDKIFRIVIPMENELDVNSEGKKRVVQRKVFPGYVLVEMIVDDKTWYIVRNTPGVTGFVGPDNKQPVPLTDSEMQEILHSEAEVAAQQQAGTVPNVAAKPVRPKIDLQLQQLVRLKTDPYTDLTGIVSEIDDERGKIKVLVNMFGRETPVEVDYTQIEKVE
jgi:transcriptional antiterminator NusG